MRQLRSNLETIHNHFRKLYGVKDGEDFAIEIEFKITAANNLAIKQARPWIFPKPFVQPPTLKFGLNHTVSSGEVYVLKVFVTHSGSNLTRSISGPDAGHFSDYTHANLIFLEEQEYDSPADANRDGVYEIDFTASASGGGTTKARLRFTVTNDELKSLAQQQWDQLSHDQRATLIPEVDSDLLKPNFANLAADVKAIVVRLARQGLLTSSGPTISVTGGGGGITEGGSASFTVSASPAPAADLDVKVTVTQSGDYGAATGQRTVTIPTTGSVAFTVDTTDDSADETDGSVTATVDAGSGYTVSSSQSAATVGVADNDDAPQPEISISGGGGITEGGSASFTVSASPAPAADLDVKVTVTQSGDYGATTGQRTVTVPTSGSVAFTVGTTDDQADEADGSVTATANAGSGYTVSSSQGAATVSVADNDDAPPPPPTPVVSISGGSGVTEGGSASFTVSASPAPSVNLDVKVTVTQSGDYGATTGQRTVTVPTSGSVAFTVGTTDDSADETDGSVTATVDAGSGYTVSSSQGAATVAVTDNDDGPDYTDYQTLVDHLIEIRDNPVNTAVKGNPVHIRKWNQVLAAIGYDSGESPMPESEIHANAAKWPESSFKLASDYLKLQAGQPEISVSGGGGITEGGSISFTVSASPAPSANLDVKVTVTQSGDYGATTGQRTVTVPTSGSVSFTVGTTDDSADETDGSVTATLVDGADYDLGPTKTATVAVADNDDATPDYTDYQTVVDYLIQVRDNPENTAVQGNPAHILKWNRVLAAIGYDSGETPMAESEIHANAARWPDSPFKAASVYLKSQAQTPVVSIAGGSGVTEGGSASFTVSASPAPSANLDVKVTVTQSGDYGATTGQRTVTIPTSGSVTFTVGTTDDQADEADGSVTATVDAGTGYTVSSSQSAATVSVADDDAPPPPPTPVVSVSGGSGITEGGSASFTVSASPAPSANLDVKVTLTQSGDYGATTGQRTVTVPTSGSVTFTVGTTDDSADEADGSVTATLVDGAAYDLGTSKTATVTVSDNDAPTPVVSITGGSGITEGGSASFTVTASPAPSANLDVKVTVTQSGDYGATTGQRTVTVPTTGSVSFTVSTTDDSADEADGSVTATVDAGTGYTVSSSQSAATVSVADNDDAPTPEISISGSNGITEGGSASFTVSASPAPSANLDVKVTITQSGDYGATTGQRTVTVPTSGSVSFTVGTTDDSADETDGSVTATVDAGSGYTVSSSQGAATVSVADNDDAPTPVVSVTGGGGITEGGDASFTVSASPAPTANLDVKVTITQSGDYGATTGQRTVTVPTTGSVTFTVGTTDDSADETDGSITATVDAGSGYTVSSSQGAATVSVADNDDAPEISVTVEDASATEGGVLTFRVRLSAASAEEITIKWYTAPAYDRVDDRAHTSDYQAAEGELVFAPGVTELTGEVWLEQDEEDEPDEYFAVEAFLPGNFLQADATGTMTIVDDD